MTQGEHGVGEHFFFHINAEWWHKMGTHPRVVGAMPSGSRCVYTNSDGKGTEGIGAMLQYQIFCMAYASLNKCNYHFGGFKNLQHYQYFNDSQEEFGKSFDRLFNLPGLSVCNSNKEHLDPSLLLRFGQENLEEIWNSNITTALNQLLFLEKSHHYFDQDYINVAVHIRVRTSLDNCNAPQREYFKHNDDAYYNNVINNIAGIDFEKPVKFHIYSQGQDTDFDLPEGCELHINEHPAISLYHMIKSDILVMGNSSFSWVSHLYGNCASVVKSSFYHTTYDATSVECAPDGSFDTDRIKELVQRRNRCIK